MTQDRHNQLLGPVDLAFWYLDDPKTPMNIGTVMILEGPVNFENLFKLVNSRIRQVPLYMQRVVTTPFNLVEPKWMYDRNFSVHNHLFHVHLEQPGTDEQLRRLTGQLISSMLDRMKPLWEIYLIDGLEDERSALLVKMHHSMVDGLSAVDIFALLLDLDRDAPIDSIGPGYHRLPPPTPTFFEEVQQNIENNIQYRMNLTKQLARETMDILSAFGDRRSRKNLLYGLTNIMNDNVPPIKPLPISGKNTGQMLLSWAEFPLDAIKAIRKDRRVWGASVNDVMMTIVGTAVERYTRAHGGDNGQDFVRFLVPVNMRSMERQEDHFGNRISVLPIDVSIEDMPVLDRLGQVAIYARVMKDSNLSSGVDMLFALTSFNPAVVQPLIWGMAPGLFSLLAHAWCTNVPGPQFPLYLLGREIEHIGGYLPLNPSMGLAAVVLSYNGKITITLVADTGIIPDVTELRGYLHEAFDELCAATGVVVEESDDQAEVSMQPVPERVMVENGNVEAEEMTAAESEVTVEAHQAEPEPETTSPAAEAEVAVETAPKLLSQPWAEDLQVAINNSESYLNSSKRWTAGSMAFVMRPSPDDGYPETSAVLLDLYKGKCRNARSLPVEEARQQASFVLEGSYESWMELLAGRSQPLPMITKGQLKLSKGPLFKLLPFSRSAQELVKCAISVS